MNYNKVTFAESGIIRFPSSIINFNIIFFIVNYNWTTSYCLEIALLENKREREKECVRVCKLKE